MAITVLPTSIDIKKGLQQVVTVTNTGTSTENVTLTNSVAGVEHNTSGSFASGNYGPFALIPLPLHLFVTDSGNNRLMRRLKEDLTFVDKDASVYNQPVFCTMDNVHVWVANQNSSTITRITKEMVYVDNYGSLGVGDDNFNQVSGVAVDDTHLFVADQSNHRIMKRLKSDFSYVSKIGTNGSGDDQFIYPQDISVDETYLYVTDYGNNRVVKRLKSDLSYVSQYGTSGSGDDQLSSPAGIAIDDTHIYIADFGNNRVVKRLKSDFSYVSKIGTTGTGNDQFTYCKGVAVDDTHLFVADQSNDRVHKRLKSDLSYVDQYGTTGGGDDQLIDPRGVCVEYNPFAFWPSGDNSKQITFKHDPSQTTLSIPSEVSFAGTNTETVFCDVQLGKDFGNITKGVSSAIYTLKVENIDSISRDVTGITAPTGFECKKQSDSAWVSSIPTFAIASSAYENIQFRSYTSEIGSVAGDANLSYNPTILISLSVISLAADFKVSYVDTHVATAKGRLIRQYRQGSNVEQICGALVGPLQQAEDDIYDLYSAWDIDTQEGVNLDRIGAIIGQDRSGFNDETYRVFLKGRVGINNSRGTLNDILALWNIFNPGATIQVKEQYPAQIELLTTATQSTQQIQDFIYELMDQSAQAGVSVVWILPYTVAGDGFFKFDSTSPADFFNAGIFNNKLNT